MVQRREFLAIVAAGLARGAIAAPADGRQLGMNLGGVIDYSSEWPFVDAFKTSRPWMEHGDGPFTYDDHGNPLLRPGQSVETFVFRDLGGHYPAGKYIATWQGTGDVEIRQFDIDAVLLKRNGRCEFTVRPGDGGILIKINASAPRDPIRGMKVWLPGFENTKQIFHPLYVERLAPFRVLRFMDWQHTNHSPLAIWSQRSKPEDQRYSTDVGVPIEVCLDLANACKADPWLCVPHLADDDFVRAFARLIKQKLPADRRCYIEYSNEVWNWGFSQTSYARDQGKRLKLGAPEHLRFYAQRSAEVFAIFETEFGGTDRLVRVISGQFVNPFDCEAILKFEDTYRKADALAVGAYFGYEFGEPKQVAQTLKMSVDELIDACSKYLSVPFREAVAKQAELAAKYKLRLLAYEGGQHLVGFAGAENNDALEALFIKANRHPNMAALYDKMLTYWFDAGGSTFVAFSYAGQPSKWGSWGTLEYQNQPLDKAPKYRALTEYSRTLSSR